FVVIEHARRRCVWSIGEGGWSDKLARAPGAGMAPACRSSRSPALYTQPHCRVTDREAVMSTVIAHPERRNLPSSGLPRLTALLGRAVKRHCPQCGAGGIFTN